MVSLLGGAMRTMLLPEGMVDKKLLLGSMVVLVLLPGDVVNKMILLEVVVVLVLLLGSVVDMVSVVGMVLLPRGVVRIVYHYPLVFLGEVQWYW